MGIAFLMGLQTAAAQTVAVPVSLNSVFSAQVEEDEIDPFGMGVDEAFFNVQGDDDAFTVYSLVDFDTTGLGPASAVFGFSLELTQSNAFFTADGALEFFLASDTRAVDTTDPARFQTNGSNVGAQVVGTDFGTLFSLGTGSFVETATGDTDTFALSFGTLAEAFAVSQINSGGILRIIATPGDLGVQATFSGSTSLLDPPAPPVLNLIVESEIVPEPSSLAVLGLFAMAGVCRRRR